jgi:Tfp pilus assembly protein PilF
MNGMNGNARLCRSPHRLLASAWQAQTSTCYHDSNPMKASTTPRDRKAYARLAFVHLWRHRLAIILVAVTFLVRFIYLVTYSRSPLFQVHIADALYHEQWARRILSGDVFSRKIPWALYKPPFYPYFIALTYFLSGKSNFLPMFLQVCMSAFSSLLAFLIGRRYFSTPAALVGALISSFYFLSVYFSAEMEIPTLAILLTLLSFYLLLGNQRILSLFTSAVTFAFSWLTLPTNVLLLPLYVFMAARKRGATTHRYRKAVLFGAVVAAIILPCMLRNQIAGNHSTFISANGGINFYIGNNEKYDQTVYLQPGYAFEEFYDEPRRLGGVDSFADRDRYWYKKAFDFILKHPDKEALLLLKKVVLYFADYEICRNTDTYYAKANSIYRNIPFVPSSLILATGLVGSFLAGRSRKHLELIAFCILQALPCVIFFVTDRYRLPSIYIWALFSGVFVTALVNMLRVGAWKPGVLASIVTASAAAISNLNLFVVKNPEYRPHLNLGFIYETQMKYDLAQEEYSTALSLVKRTKPHDVKIESELYDRLGNVYMSSGNLAAARKNFEQALAVNPHSGPAYSYLGTINDKEGQGALALEMFNRAIEINPWDTVSIHNLGLFYLNNHQFDQAIAKLKRVIELDPGDSGAHSDLAYAYGTLDNYPLMEAEAKTAVDYDPEGSTPRYNLALAYLNTGRVEEAIAQYRVIAQIAPRDSSNAYNQLGVICAQQGDLKQAIDHWQNALGIDPTNLSAQVNLRKARMMLQ